MSKFAHLADIHLGAHRDPVLRELELAVFNQSMDKCVQLDVDFILIAGDFFHVGIPDLGIVNKSLLKIRDVQDAGIPIYVIYGSHDYTPSGTSVIDIFDTSRMLTKIVKMKMDNGKLKLNFFVDPKTGAKLTGISARKIGLEREYYKVLDNASLEREDGFKIFAFHSGLTELKPAYLSEMETIPISYFPKGFDYYAGGHIHERGEFNLPGYENVVFPGPLFTGYGKDIEATAKGEKRGFYVVSFADKVTDINFVEIKNFDGVYFEYDATGKNSLQVSDGLHEKLIGLDVDSKVVVYRVTGTLSGGKSSDVNFMEIKSRMINNGARYVHRLGVLPSQEYSAVRVADDISLMERKLFKENLGAVKTSQVALKDESSVLIASELLKILRQEPKINESKSGYTEKMIESGIVTLNLKDMFKVFEE